MHYTKIRGVPFDPIDIRIAVVELNNLKTSRGKPVTSVIATPTTAADADHACEVEATNEDHLLIVISRNPKGPQRQWAIDAGWVSAAGKPETGRLARTLETLKADKFVAQWRKNKPYRLTEKGQKHVDQLLGKQAQDGLSGG
jgi:hypothetical protein